MAFFVMVQCTYERLDSVKLNPNNPRIVRDDKFAKLVKSIKDFPQMLELRPIVVNDDMIVLGGNMRLKACKEAGLKEIPVIRASSLTPEQQREFIIKDNLGYGEWDWDLIANEWDEEQLADWGLDIPDFKIQAEAHEDDYEVPDEIQTDIVLGDLFEIGEHRLLCGDSTNADDVGKLLNGKEPYLMVTDPPYGVVYDPFLGSGTTMVASHQLNRKCYGIELDPKYCQVIIDRMKKLDPSLVIKRNGVQL